MKDICEEKDTEEVVSKLNVPWIFVNRWNPQKPVERVRVYLTQPMANL